MRIRTIDYLGVEVRRVTAVPSTHQVSLDQVWQMLSELETYEILLWNRIDEAQLFKAYLFGFLDEQKDQSKCHKIEASEQRQSTIQLQRVIDSWKNDREYARKEKIDGNGGRTTLKYRISLVQGFEEVDLAITYSFALREGEAT